VAKGPKGSAAGAGRGKHFEDEEEWTERHLGVGTEGCVGVTAFCNISSADV
jgi:hypothetical protein